MGQYWTVYCKIMAECIRPICGGQKYVEEWGNLTFHKMLFMLKTNTSSLGVANGDIIIEDIPPPLQKFIKPYLGKWCNADYCIAGDYNEDFDEDDYTDITKEVFCAFCAYHLSQDIRYNKDFAQVKEHFMKWLHTDVYENKAWQNDSSIQNLLQIAESIIASKEPAQKKAKTEKELFASDSDSDSASEDESK